MHTRPNVPLLPRQLLGEVLYLPRRTVPLWLQALAALGFLMGVVALSGVRG